MSRTEKLNLLKGIENEFKSAMQRNAAIYAAMNAEVKSCSGSPEIAGVGIIDRYLNKVRGMAGQCPVDELDQEELDRTLATLHHLRLLCHGN